MLASGKPSRVIARACHVSHEKNLCVIDVDEGATLEMDAMLRRGYTYSPSFAWQDGNLTKAGPGTLKLLKPLSIKGRFDIREGTVELAEGGYIDPSAQVMAGKDAKLILNDGTRFVAKNAVAVPSVLSDAEVWIDATRVSAADGATLETVANLGSCGGDFGKFPTAVSGGIIPEAPKYVAKGIGGKPSFGFNGYAALKLDSYRNTDTNCEMFAVGCWTNWYGAGSQGQWGGFVSLGSVQMVNNEDQYNKGVVSCYFSGADKGSVITTVANIFGNHIDGNSEKKQANCSISSADLKTSESFILRLHRGDTSAEAELWRSDSNVKTASKSPYPVPEVQKYTRVDRVSIGSRLASGGCATTYAAGSASTRNMIGWIGEVLVFSKALTADERAAVNDYLRRKWIGTKAEETSALAEGKTGTLAVETPTGAKASAVAGLAGDGQRFAIAKTGAGELTVGGGAGDAALSVDVREGSIRLQEKALASRAAIWIDADDAATCFCDGENVTNLVNKGSCGGSFVRATPTGTVPMHYPKLTANGINGRRTLTFDGEAALITSCYTNRTAPRRMSVYAVWRRNSWRLHPDADNGGGYGKWATVYTFVPANAGAADENIPGVFHVDESTATTAYAEFGNYNTESFSVPTNGEVAIFTAHMTTNGYSVAHEKVATDVTKVPHYASGGTVYRIEPANVDRVILGGRADSKARVHYKGTNSTANRCWYGDLAEMVVVTEPLSVEEEAALYAYLRKKWMNKGSGSATPPTWLSGETAAPQFGAQTTLAMADGTGLAHEAGEVKLGALETEGTVDWTRVWSGEDVSKFSLFDVTGDVSLGNVNLMSDPLVRKTNVKVFGYGGSALTTPTWQVFRPDGRLRPGASVADRGNGYWLWGQVGTLLMMR